MVETSWKLPKSTQNSKPCCEYLAQYCLDARGMKFIDYYEKEKQDTGEIYVELLDSLNDPINE